MISIASFKCKQCCDLAIKVSTKQSF